MAKQQPEARLVARIRRAISREWPTAYVVKYHGSPFTEAGVPDLLCCIEGRFIGLEVKVPGREDTVTALQTQHLLRIGAARGIPLVGTDPDEVVENIRRNLLDP